MNNEQLTIDRSILQKRREHLASLISTPVILWSGCAAPRNFPANRFPFRASSHFLYFAGLPLENAAIRLENGKLELFMDEAPAIAALWHGESLSPAKLAAIIGADASYPLEKLSAKSANAATIALSDYHSYRQQWRVLDRELPQEVDLNLARAIVSLRLSHDAWALEELRKAAQISVQAHAAGMAAVCLAKTEAEVRGAMEGAIISQNMTCAYNSIVTVHGEVLHNEQSYHPLERGDLLLADVGAETPLGWAADISRTFPVTGKFSPTQKDIYEVVLAAHDACIDALAPGVEYRDIHLLGAQIIAEGLVSLGILRGNPADLVARDAHALFFPHGIGHLLGLDVHDMEDLGDLAGYGEGRKRSDRFGLCYLRLDRTLQPGMLVTIEPGFYQVPAILTNPGFREKYQDAVNWDVLQKFSDVLGIRIEDDVLVTNSGREVLTAQLPTKIDEIEQLIG
jgi:Xaa-Pro aminopeptidase